MKRYISLLLVLIAAGCARPASPAAQTFSAPGFRTDWSKIAIDPAEIRSGGPPKDGIPALDDPSFDDAAAADEWLGDKEAVIVVEAGGETKAYPLQILAWHEIVNDEVGGVPLSVTWCPLCNTTVVFRREVDGRVLDFGTTGRLRYSNLLMYDRQTESWWQQADGAAVIGEYTGTELSLYPAVVAPWGRVRDRPGIRVVSQRTGHSRPYGSNPYRGYDNPANFPFLLDRGVWADLEVSTQSPLERAVVTEAGDERFVLGYSTLRERRAVNLEGADPATAVFWEPGTASALDTSELARGRDVGTANAFLRELDGRTLTFVFENGAIRDTNTGSVWNALGEAVEGSLAGRRLSPAPTVQHFWFSAALFEKIPEGPTFP